VFFGRAWWTGLVLADWLEEHDEPERAEFIRLQLRFASGGLRPGPSRLAKLIRCGQLLARHGGAWLGSLWRHGPESCRWHRGLLTARLRRHTTASAISDILPWADTLLLE
jgi:hypothetical protein